MKKIRVPFFGLAVVALLAVVLIEIGSVQAADVASRLPPFLLGRQPLPLKQSLTLFADQQDRLDQLLSQTSPDEIARLQRGNLSGFSVRSLQFIDGLLLFTIVLMAMTLFLPRFFPRYEYLHAKFQGIATLVFDIIVILAANVLLVFIIGKLMLMITLLLSFPFGTLAYLIIYGSFPRGAMTAVLSLIFFLKLLFGVSLVMAHKDFINHLSFVIYILAALVANLIVALLYGVVPGILVSITDAIAAIVMIIIGVILALVMAVGAVLSIVKAFKLA